MTNRRHQFKLIERLEHMSDLQLAEIYLQYIDSYTLALMDGLMAEMQRRGLELTDLEQIIRDNDL